MTRLLSSLSLLAALVALPGPVAAQHGHGMGGMAPSFRGTQARVEVQHVAPSGATSALAGAEVLLEAWSQAGMGGAGSLVAARTAITGSDGVATFSALGDLKGTQLKPSVVYKGVTYAAEGIEATGRVTLRVYEPTGRPSDLKMSVFGNLDVREKQVIVGVRVGLENSGREVLDYDRRAEGLRVPLLLPAIYGGAMRVGVIPGETAARHMAMRLTPDRGRLVFEGGHLVYRGPVLPGERQTLEVRYALPIVEERQDLAFAAPVDLSSVTLDAVWSQKIAPRVFFEAPFTSVERDEALNHRRRMRLLSEPKAEQAVVVRVDRLPRAVALQATVAWGGMSVLVLVFVLALVAGRTRRE